MLETIKQYQFLIGALTGSLAAYLLGLVVNHYRREKKWLGFSVSTRNIVSQAHSHLKMKFDQRDISRLDSHTIVLRNVGNRPLTSLPVRLECKGGEIVEHEFNKPDGMSIESGFKSANELIVTCDLINPGEAVTVGLTVADSEDGKVKVIARAENLHLKQIEESGTTEELLEALVGTSSLAAFAVSLGKLWWRR